MAPRGSKLHSLQVVLAVWVELGSGVSLGEDAAGVGASVLLYLGVWRVHVGSYVVVVVFVVIVVEVDQVTGAQCRGRFCTESRVERRPVVGRVDQRRVERLVKDAKRPELRAGVTTTPSARSRISSASAPERVNWSLFWSPT
jgi:hypothetical protein